MFQEVLQRCVDVNDEEYGLQVTRDDGVVEQNRKLFLSWRVVSLRVWSLRVVSLRGWSREF